MAPTTVFAAPTDNDETQQIIEKSKKDASDLLKNWDKIKVATPEEYSKILTEKNKILGLESETEIPMLASASAASSVGTIADVLVTPSNVLGGGSITGHAALVVNSINTIESFPSGGVQYKLNDWKTRYSKILCGIVRGTTDYQGAVNYAVSKKGYGYNAIIGDKWTTAKFYCSQLVWRAWDNATLNYPVDLDKSY